MSHAALTRLRRQSTLTMTRSDSAEDALSMRLLRHHTKNALQRIIAQISNAELRTTAPGNVLADDIERRIQLSARISDALFGMTETPGPLPTRLTSLCQSVVALMSDGVQAVEVRVGVVGTCPAQLEPTVLQVAHELVTNAVKHGMHMRLAGEIEVTLCAMRPGSQRSAVRLTVRDDGWGPDLPGFGEGMTTLQAIADRHGGEISLARDRGWTVAQLRIPGVE